MLVKLELHVTTRPVTIVPFTSLTVAVSCTVLPTYTVAGDGVTMTLPTGVSVTVMLAVPLLPSLVAVIVAVPAPTPVTTPLDETVAMDVLLDVQVIVRPVSTFPLASLVVAVSVVV